jgi:YggT family protein
MGMILGVLSYVAYAYFLLILARFVIEWTRMFARSWRPAGTAAVAIESVYMSTDPPVRLLRRLIPPLRLGNFRFDISMWILLIAAYVISRVLYAYSVA